MRGYFGIGIENCKTTSNIGTLWRSAYNLGASFIFTVGKRYRHQCSDTTRADKHIPFYEYDTLEEFTRHVPVGSLVIGVEYPHARAVPIQTMCHPERAVYLLGAEDRGLSQEAIAECDSLIYIPTKQCLNVSVAGSLIMYDRQMKTR